MLIQYQFKLHMRCPSLRDAARSLLPRSGTAQAQGKTCGGRRCSIPVSHPNPNS
ncbi:MAG: hypothetical protein ACYTX0_62815 [Nostoc sp.]